MQNINDLQEAESNTEVSLWFYVILIVLVLWTVHSLKQARQRNRRVNNNIRFIDRDKIIIAIEIKDLVVKYAEKSEYGYLPFQIATAPSLFEKWWKKVFSLGHYYKPIFPVTKIKEFMQGLASINNVSLILYTSLQERVTEVILHKLGIESLFPSDMRKFCDLENRDDQKHAIQVDQDSRRVIIITPTYDDHRHEDQKYFLVLRPKPEEPYFLRNWLRELKNFIERNQNLNNLHDQLAQFKINYDSELSDYEI